jgi:prolycopene isomerase
MAERKTQQQLQRAYDCVVVGAGNGGLSAAAQLAAKGVKVLLLEQHTVPGGFATSFVRGRFEFEVSLHAFCDIGSPTARGGAREYLEDELGVYLDWVEIPEAYRLILTDPAKTWTSPYPMACRISSTPSKRPRPEAKSRSQTMSICARK